MAQPVEWECLGNLLELSKVSIQLLPESEYDQITVRINHKGVVKRGSTLGVEILSKQHLAKSGQFIVSKIDARNGAMGLVPEFLDGAVVSNDFLLFNAVEERLDLEYLNYISQTPFFDHACHKASEGSTNRRRLKLDRFFEIKIPLPKIDEQIRLRSKANSIFSNIKAIEVLRAGQIKELRNLAYSRFTELIAGLLPFEMRKIAPLVRRPVAVDYSQEYPELGRSFGKGAFHKPALLGIKVGSKKLYEIHEGDLLLSNVFAWEGAIAVAQKEDHGRVGSHRYITRKCDLNNVLPRFLCYYFLTPEGLEKIRLASPGGAGRNKTLGLKKLDKILVPIPPIQLQKEFIEFLSQIELSIDYFRNTGDDLDTLKKAVLDKAFKGEPLKTTLQGTLQSIPW